MFTFRIPCQADRRWKTCRDDVDSPSDQQTKKKRTKRVIKTNRMLLPKGGIKRLVHAGYQQKLFNSPVGIYLEEMREAKPAWRANLNGREGSKRRKPEDKVGRCIPVSRFFLGPQQYGVVGKSNALRKVTHDASAGRRKENMPCHTEKSLQIRRERRGGAGGGSGGGGGVGGGFWGLVWGRVGGGVGVVGGGAEGGCGGVAPVWGVGGDGGGGVVWVLGGGSPEGTTDTGKHNLNTLHDCGKKRSLWRPHAERGPLRFPSPLNGQKGKRKTSILHKYHHMAIAQARLNAGKGARKDAGRPGSKAHPTEPRRRRGDFE